MTTDDELRRERAVANARVLAQELARREAGGKWNRPLRLAPLVTRSDSGPSRLSRPDRASDHDRPKAAVVAWDLAHNMAARARVLGDLLSTFAETDMIGGLWDDFGSELWPPLRDRPNEPITFPAHGLTDFLAQAYAVAAATGDYQLLHICKPRFPGLLYGALLQRANNCSILLDIDENEQSFVGDVAPAVEVGIDELEALKRPMDDVGTALGISLGLKAPVRTVSNTALQRHLGGSIIRHARDEHDFEMSDELRAQGRELLGAGERDFVILFMGTPRPHKGLDVIVEALGLLDDGFVLHVVGSTGQLGVDTSRARVVSHPLVPFSEVPIWLAGCDAIVLMQDPEHPISQFQIPAKIADGLSMGLPVVATDVPPMADLPPNVVLRANDAAALAERLLELRETDDPQATIDRRALFRAEFSNTVNGARLQLLATLADDIPRETFASFVAPVLDHARAAYRFHRRRFHRENSARPDAEDTGPDASGTDLIVFAGSSGLPAVIAEELLALGEDPRVRSVSIIDPPLAATELARLATEDNDAELVQAVVDRRLELADRANVAHRTMLFRDADGSNRDPFTGEQLPEHGEFAQFVADHGTRLGVDRASAVAWVDPGADDGAAACDDLGFSRVVTGPTAAADGSTSAAAMASELFD